MVRPFGAVARPPHGLGWGGVELTGLHGSPWARPPDAGPPTGAGAQPGGSLPSAAETPAPDSDPAVDERDEWDEREIRAAEELRAWRARASATADPAWSRSGSAAAATLTGDRGARGESASALDSARPWALPSFPGRDGTGGKDGASPGHPAARTLRGWRGLCGRCAWIVGPVAICAGIGVIIASGMRWATVQAYGLIEIDVHGTDPDQHGRLTVVLGILAVVAGLLLAAGRYEWGCMLAIMTGLMVLLTAVVDLVHLYEDGPFPDSGLPEEVAVGPGLWLVAFCGFVVMLVGVSARTVQRFQQREVKQRARKQAE